MKKLTTIFLSLSLAILESCSWVNDNYDHCPTGTWVQLSYTYNMLYSEAIATHITGASLFVMDEEGNRVTEKTVSSATLQENNYRVQLPDLPTGNYHICVWAGLEDPNYLYSDTGIALNMTGEVHNQALGNLLYGRVDKVNITQEYQIVEVPMVKDNKLITTTLQLLSQQGTLKADEFGIEISANNRQIDNNNQPSGAVVYSPILHTATQLDGLHVVQSGFHTLRLLQNDGTRMKLTHLPTQSKVFDIPLTDYLILSGMTDLLNMGEQEYLDREDQFNLIFFLNETQIPDRPYACTLLQIRSWILRMNETEL